MKKISAVFALFTALIFVVSCGGGSKNVNQNDESDTGDTVTDNDTADSGSTDNPDSENPDSDNPNSGNPDTAPDAGDSAPDKGDSTPDNDADSTDSAPDNDADAGDSVPDSDNEDPVNENPDNLPECSPTSSTPCKDSSSGLIWSARGSSMTWNDAENYCSTLLEGDYPDWRLPTISELRTLIQNCSKTETDGTCGVTDDCLSYSECRNSDCRGCTYDDNKPGQYSKFGETGYFWSSSVLSDYPGVAWLVDFYNGNVRYDDKTVNLVRCVR